MRSFSSATRTAGWSLPVLPSGCENGLPRLSISTRSCHRRTVARHTRRSRSRALPRTVVPPPARDLSVNAKDAAWVDSKMTPHPVKCFTEHFTSPAPIKRFPKRFTFVRATFPPRLRRCVNRCQADRAWRTFEMKCGHDACWISRASCNDSRWPGAGSVMA